MKNKFLSLALSAALLTLFLMPAGFADESTDVDVTVADGDLELSLAGAWTGTLEMTGSIFAGVAGVAEWTSQGEMTDYILVKDFDTANPGFEVTITATDLTDDAGIEKPIKTKKIGQTGIALKFDEDATPKIVEVPTGSTPRTEAIAINLAKSGTCAKTSELTWDSGFDGGGVIHLEGIQDLLDASTVFNCTSQIYISPYKVKAKTTSDTGQANYSGTITLGANEVRS